MERKRGIIIGVIISVIISIISLGVTFAALSTTLTINGTGAIKGTKWDLHFSVNENGDAPSGEGINITPFATSGTAQSTSAILKGGDFTWTAEFKSPGDMVEYRFYMVNKGDYDAVLTGTFTSTVTCSINDVPQATCPVNYTITKNGTTPFNNNEVLAKNESHTIVVRAQLDPNFTGTQDDITVNTTQVVFTYTQKLD